MPSTRRRPVRRSPSVRALLAAPFGLGCTVSSLVGQAPDPDRFDAIAEAVSNLAPDPTATARIQGATLTRGSGELELVDGTLALLAPVDGRRIGAVFDGDGRFRMTAPLAVEREQLVKFFDTETIDVTFDGALLLFTDGTLAELEAAGVTFDGSAPLDDHGDILDDADDYLVDDDTKDIDRTLLSGLLHPDRPAHALFFAHLVPGGERSSGRALFYRVAASADESIELGRAAGGDTYELIASFRPPASYLGDPTAVRPRTVGVAVARYTIEMTIESGLDVEASARMSLTPREAGGFWTALNLTSLVQVDSARWGSGEPADIRRQEDGYDLWLRIPERLTVGQDAQVTVWYHGSDLLEDTRDWYYLRSATAWYPRNGRDRSTFDITFHTPRDREIVSVGAQVADTVVDRVRTTRWVTEFPALHASFNYGEMDASVLVDPRIPPVALTINEQAHRTIAYERARATGLPETDLDRVRRDVEADVANSISFFTTWFGTPPITTLRVTEIPFSHGQAFPGMIHLSWVTYEGMGNEGYDEMFRAHEVAHQWWGLGVQDRTYRDVWLTEGFAEFAGLWYLNTMLEEPELYLDRLRDTKRDILGRRDEAPPIGLGRRAASRDRPRDYQTMIYDKGAWVLHMLRNIFLDLQTLDESRFVEMLRDFYLSFAGGDASTEDFRRVVETHLGADMGWFFDQWIYSSAIPTYRVEYCGGERADGGYTVALRVEQERVPDTFQMYVPIRLDLGDEGSARFRIGVAGPVTEVELPPLPGRPARIVFNEFESVLAEVRDRGWECREGGSAGAPPDTAPR